MTRSKSHRSLLQINYPTGVKEITQDLPKDELVRRLKMLARALQDMEQEDDNNQYESLAIHITENFFLKHSSKDVRLLVACCVADVFRIFAPEAPFRTASQLKTIFKFLCEQLWDLENTNSPSWKRYFYLLENLAMVKSFNICMELEDSNEIFIRLFTIFFSIVNKNHPPKVRGFMLDVMCPLISENDSVSPDLLEVILKNLVDSKKVENPFANVLARDLIKRTATSIEPAMQSYFNNALVLGKSSDSELSKHTYELIYQLNLISNNLLLAVLPQLEFKLKTSEEKERLAVTKLLGRMFSDKESDLASNNKPLWNCFLGRFSDISTLIRIECIKFVPTLITNHPYLAEDLADRLRERVHDVEDDVRSEAVTALVDAAKKDITIVTDEMLQLVKERTLDKRWKIRKEAILGLAHTYKKWCYTEDASTKDKERLLWIKDKILHSYYLPDLEDKLLVERIFTMNLVPYTLEVSERMQRFLELFVTVDEHSVKAIVELIKCQHIVRTHVRDLLEIVKGQKDGNQTKAVFSKIVSIGKCLPDNSKTQEHLKKMVKSLKEDAALFSFMKVVLSPDVTCKKAAHAVGEIMKRFSSQKTSLLYNTVKTLMERIAPLIQDASATREFLSLLVGYTEGKGREIKGREDKEIIQKGLRLMQTLAHVYPYTFNSEESFNHLVTMIKNEDVPNLSDTALQTLTQVGDGFEGNYPKAAQDLNPILTNLALTANPKQAKHSIRCINCVFSTSKKEIFETIFQKSQQSLSLEHEHYFTALTTVAHIAHLAPEQFLGPMKTVIAGTIVKSILMQDRTEGSKCKGIWCQDDQLSEETQGKLLAIKVLVHWLLGLGRNISGSVISTIRLLTTMLKNEGDLMERKKIGRADMSRLRLAAGSALLKLAQVPAFAEFISLEQFQLIALLINDECFQVREKFAEKLNKGLISLRLPLSYLSILSLCIKDPVKENHKKAGTYIKQCVDVRRQYLKQHNLTGVAMLAVLPEYVIPHAVHLLSHDPDFITPKDLESLNDIKECLWFIMEPLVVKPESCSFIRKMLETIKQMKDAQAVEDKTTANKKLYAVCEVALGLLTTKLPGVFKDHQGDILLPARLFVKPKKPVNPRESYLPKKLQQEFSNAETKEAQQKEKEDKTSEKKKTGKGAAGKKKAESGDENQSPLGKKEKKPTKAEKAEEKKETKSNRKVLTQKEVNDTNSSRRSLRGKVQSPQKKTSSPRKQTSPEKGLSSPESTVKSPNPKTKQTLMSKYVTSKSKSGDQSSSPSPQKSPTKRPSSLSSTPSSPPKRRRGTASAKSSKHSEQSEKSSPSKNTTKAKGVKELLRKKDKKDGEKTIVKSKKVATIKRVAKASPKKETTSPQKRRASSPMKSPPEKRSKGSSAKESPKKSTKKPATKKDSPKASGSTTKTSPAKVSPKKKTPAPAPSGSKRLRQAPKAGQVAKKASPSPSPKKSPVKTVTRKLSPSPARSTRSASTGRRGRPPIPAKKVSPPPAKKVSSAQEKKVSSSPAKKVSSAQAKKVSSSPAKKVMSPPVKKVSSPPAKSKQQAKKQRKASSKSPASSPSSSPAKSPKPAPMPKGAKSLQSGKKEPPSETRSATRSQKSLSSPTKSSPVPTLKNKKSPATKKTVKALARNTRATGGRSVSPSKGSPSGIMPSRTSRSPSKKSIASPQKTSPSPTRKVPVSPSKSLKSPPNVRRAASKKVIAPKVSPPKKVVQKTKSPVKKPTTTKTKSPVKKPNTSKTKSPVKKPTTTKTKSPVKKPTTTKTRSTGKTPTRETVKRKLVESDSDAKSSPARSSRSSSSSAKSSPVKSPSPKKNVRQASNLRNTSKGSKTPVKGKSGKESPVKRKAGSVGKGTSPSPSPSPKKRKIESPSKSPKKAKNSSPAKSALNISRRSHKRKKR